jgi:hypothetical protein
MMLRHAFKEWAVICRALGEGRQALIIRKGGIAEADGEFTPEHHRFWLYPTYMHQQREGIKPEAVSLLQDAEADRLPPTVVRLSYFAEVSTVYPVHQLDLAMSLDRLHCWSQDTVRQRFAYRRPGFYVMPVRIFGIREPIELTELPAYEGCKTWVDLERDLSTADAVPVLSDRAYADVLESIDAALHPTARA